MTTPPRKASVSESTDAGSAALFFLACVPAQIALPEMSISRTACFGGKRGKASSDDVKLHRKKQELFSKPCEQVYHGLQSMQLVRICQGQPFLTKKRDAGVPCLRRVDHWSPIQQQRVTVEHQTEHSTLAFRYLSSRVPWQRLQMRRALTRG